MWPALHLLASGYDVHFVFMSRGGVTAASIKLDGSAACSLPDHLYVHNPVQEGYAALTQEEIGLIRLREGFSAVGAMGMITPTNPLLPGHVFRHDENLPTQWGNGTGSGAPTEAGITQAQDIIKRYIDDLPNTFFYTMSPTDDHPDHAACGIALRRLKGDPVRGIAGDPVYGPKLGNAMFFSSKLYWGNATTPRHPALALEQNAWYPNNYPDNTKKLARIAEYSAHLKNKVIKPYLNMWVPADVDNGTAITRGAFAIGGHQVAGQFANAIQTPAEVSALWHP